MTIAEGLACPTASADVLAAVRAALTGGPAVAPLPDEVRERDQALRAIRPDLPLESDLVAPGDLGAVVLTSGSTGRPKAVLLPRAALVAAAEAALERLGGPGNWISALPPHYVAGLMVLVRAAVGDADVAFADPGLGDLAANAAQLSGRRYLSVVPPQLARGCSDPALVPVLASLDAVLVGGGPLDPELDRRARALGIPVVTTYGMSETCGGCVFDGVPLAGVDVEIDPDTSRIRVAGPVVFSGYRLAPDLTAQALHGSTVSTSDRGRWVNGRLQVLGRLDDVVVSGGRNVDLFDLELRARAGGREVAILGLPHPEWGTSVVAVGTGDETLAELHARLGEDLPSYALPRELVRVAALPRTGSGKVDRKRLVDQLAERRAAAAPTSRA